MSSVFMQSECAPALYIELHAYICAIDCSFYNFSFANVYYSLFITYIAAVSIVSSSPPTYASENSLVVLECTAHGNPRPDGIEWRTTNSLYTTTELSNMTNEVSVDAFTVVSHLAIPFITLENRGNYTCVAYNEIEMTQMSDEETVVLFVLGMF